MDLVGADGGIEALADGEHHLELVEIGLESRGHVGVLQLAGDLAAFRQFRVMHLPQRRGKRGFLVEAHEPRGPVRAQLCRHAPFHERPAHGWRVGLKLGQFVRILGRQRIGNGGEKLRRLHQRPLEAAQRAAQFGGMLAAVEVPAEIALTGETRRQAADRGADPSIAAEPPAQRWTLVISHR